MSHPVTQRRVSSLLASMEGELAEDYILDLGALLAADAAREEPRPVPLHRLARIEEMAPMFPDQGPRLQSLLDGEAHPATVFRVEPAVAWVDLGGALGVLTQRTFSREPVSDLTAHLRAGDQIQVKLLRLFRDDLGALVGRREIDQRPLKEIRTAQVVHVEELGAVVRLDTGEQAFLPRRELGWLLPRGIPTRALIRPGEEIAVEVTFHGRPLRASRKALQPDPWPEIRARYAPGTYVWGTVISHTSNGLLVELEPGVDGRVGPGGPPRDVIPPPVHRLFPVGSRVHVMVICERPPDPGARFILRLARSRPHRPDAAAETGGARRRAAGPG